MASGVGGAGATRDLSRLRLGTESTSSNGIGGGTRRVDFGDSVFESRLKGDLGGRGGILGGIFGGVIEAPSALFSFFPNWSIFERLENNSRYLRI